MTSQSKADRDPHVLYQRAVQSPDVDAEFLDRLYRRNVGRPAELLREDFCGTAAIACSWLNLGPRRRALGIDLHAPTLEWGEKHNLSQLSEEQRQRIRLLQANVLDVRRPKADIICAFNFSYSVLKTREELQAYANNARRSLAPGGLFVIDAWGGPLTQQPRRERKRLRGGVTYIWEQVSFDPISHDIDCRIHFEFKDGPRMRNAFVYDWRLWTLPELREVMQQAGLEDVHVLWDGTTSTGQSDGVYKRRQRGDSDPSWVVYVVGKAPD